MMNNEVYIKDKNLIESSIEGETIIVPLVNSVADMNSMFSLNETAAFIWKQIDGKKSINYISELLQNEFTIDKETADNDTIDFVNKALKEKIILKK